MESRGKAIDYTEFLAAGLGNRVNNEVPGGGRGILGVNAIFFWGGSPVIMIVMIYNGNDLITNKNR